MGPCGFFYYRTLQAPPSQHPVGCSLTAPCRLLPDCTLQVPRSQDSAVCFLTGPCRLLPRRILHVSPSQDHLLDHFSVMECDQMGDLWPMTVTTDQLWPVPRCDQVLSVTRCDQQSIVTWDHISDNVWTDVTGDQVGPDVTSDQVWLDVTSCLLKSFPYYRVVVLAGWLGRNCCHAKTTTRYLKYYFIVTSCQWPGHRPHEVKSWTKTHHLPEVSGL